MVWAPSAIYWASIQLLLVITLILLFFVILLINFSKKDSSLKEGFPQELAYHIFSTGCIVMSSLLHLVRPQFVLAGSRVGGAPVAAQMVWELWGTISGHLCQIYTSLFLATSPAHTDTSHWRKWGNDKKQIWGSPCFPQVVRQTDTVFWPSPVSLQGSVFIWATLLSLLCLWFT